MNALYLLSSMESLTVSLDVPHNNTCRNGFANITIELNYNSTSSPHLQVISDLWQYWDANLNLAWHLDSYKTRMEAGYSKGGTFPPSRNRKHRQLSSILMLKHHEATQCLHHPGLINCPIGRSAGTVPCESPLSSHTESSLTYTMSILYH